MENLDSSLIQRLTPKGMDYLQEKIQAENSVGGNLCNNNFDAIAESFKKAMVDGIESSTKSADPRLEGKMADSGARVIFDGGAMVDPGSELKGRFDLIPWDALTIVLCRHTSSGSSFLFRNYSKADLDIQFQDSIHKVYQNYPTRIKALSDMALAIFGLMNAESNSNSAYTPLPAIAFGNCIHPDSLTRIAKWYELGAIKYTDRNWEKGIPFSRRFDSALRHYTKYLRRLEDEDHLAACAWNLLALIWYHIHEMYAFDDIPFWSENFSLEEQIDLIFNPEGK